MNKQGVCNSVLKSKFKKGGKIYSLENKSKGQLLSFTDLIDCIWEMLILHIFWQVIVNWPVLQSL